MELINDQEDLNYKKDKEFIKLSFKYNVCITILCLILIIFDINAMLM